MGYDFPGFLGMWIFCLHQQERDFWKSMNPRRLSALRKAIEPPKKQTSLSEYLKGGAE